MTDATSQPAPTSGAAVVLKVVESFVSGFALLAAADLGIADALAGGPRTSEELSGVIGAHPPSLTRLLRLVATTGVVSEVEPGRFALTAMGAALRSGPESVGPGLALVSGLMLPPLAETAQAVRTGEAAFARLFGAPLYEYLERHPELDEALGRTMNILRAISGPITDAYDFSDVGTLVDVGGGQGWRMIEVLQAHPHVRAILFDRPVVVEHARGTLADAGIDQRCDVVGGSFFDEIPTGGDCYLLSAVIPNWDDAAALTILRNTRKAMPDDARLLLFEPVLPEGDAPHIGKTIDLLMLVLLGGQIRSEPQLAGLLAAAGLGIRRVVSTPSPVAVVEAVPV